MKKNFLKVNQTKILNGSKEIFLRGVNFGGWLMMEGYFMHAPNLAQQVFEKDFLKKHSKKELDILLEGFRNNFINEEDFKRVSSWGINSIRLPFHYKIASAPQQIKYIDRAITWAKKYRVYIILDLHGTYGAQNHDWHSDSTGKAELWTKKSNCLKTYELWQKIADRYKDEEIIAGYDLLNESVIADPKLLNEFYKETIKAIRQVDRQHLLFIEGNRWAQDISILEDFKDDNWVYSIHFYEPLEYTFNFIPFMKYPLKGWDKNVMRKRLEGYAQFSKKKQRPIHVGEFGVHYREGLYGEDVYLQDELKCFNDFGFHWNYWTYKAMKNYMFPDGILSYYPNSAWVHRPGPKHGWFRWADCWPQDKKAMFASWRTSSFELNSPILEKIKESVKV